MSTRRAAVLGHPVAHSLSPVLHRAAYAALGLDWEYEALDVTEDGLAEVIARLDHTWAGLSLTMPLKQAVLPLLDHVEPLAQVVGAANTVLVQPGEPPVLVGANTDVPGMVVALGEGTGEPVGRAVVLGGGATASSALAAVAQLGCTTPQVRFRSMARAGAVVRAAHRMGVEPRLGSLAQEDLLATLAGADVVVSALPSRAADSIAAELAAADATVRGVLLDCAYDPRPTALGTVWRAAGGVVVGGERLLLHQAAEQVRLMTGRVAPLAAMEAALAGALDGPAGAGG